MEKQVITPGENDSAKRAFQTLKPVISSARGHASYEI
jgi:hypothetical protein